MKLKCVWCIAHNPKTCSVESCLDEQFTTNVYAFSQFIAIKTMRETDGVCLGNLLQMGVRKNDLIALNLG